MRSLASRLPAASAAHAAISDTTSPAPNRATSRRNGASVTPDIGARNTRFAMVTLPTARGSAGRGELSTFIDYAYILGERVICIEFSHYNRAAQVLQCNIVNSPQVPTQRGQVMGQTGLFDPL